jgi:aryl-alcohol dehydrogenase-like predicted oxidoreductase
VIRRKLGRGGLEVPALCLGTMTFGRMVDEPRAHAILSAAAGSGVSFIDTGEMYPAPAPDAASYGRTEEMIGRWLQARGGRDKLQIASKVAGRAPYTAHIRDGRNQPDRVTIRAAIEGSLRRLGTDYIDLYQIHWPDRRTNALMELSYVHDPADRPVSPEETLAALSELVDEGKVRAIGLSNETPWGVWRFLEASERLGLCRIASVQNAYSLLARGYEIGLAEFAFRDDVPLIGYQPLAMGMLTGIYADGATPPGRRLTRHPHVRYTSPAARRAASRYAALARAWGMAPADMAIAFAAGRPFMASLIIAATEVGQLAAQIAAADLALPPELLAAIDAIHRDGSNPCQ